jgi:hypothetical protein
MRYGSIQGSKGKRSSFGRFVARFDSAAMAYVTKVYHMARHAECGAIDVGRQVVSCNDVPRHCGVQEAHHLRQGRSGKVPERPQEDVEADAVDIATADGKAPYHVMRLEARRRRVL